MRGPKCHAILLAFAGCALSAGCRSDVGTGIGPGTSHPSNLLAGTWVGQARDLAISLPIPAATCSNYDCSVRAPGTFTRGGATQTSFGEDVLFFETVPRNGAQIFINFLTDTGSSSENYPEQFTGRLLDSSHMGGVIRQLPTANPQRALASFGITDSLAITFTRQ